MANEQPDSGISTRSVLASDAEREATVARLNDAGREGRLQLDEFSDRVDRALSARTRGELDDLVHDLPAPDSDVGAGPVSGAPARQRSGSGSTQSTQWNISPLGGMRRKGHWLVGGNITNLTLLGGMRLDLREAEFSSPQVTLTSFSLLGGVRLLVPPGVNVVVSGFHLLGGRRIDSDELSNPGAPTIYVRSFGLIGGVRVRRSPRRERGERRSARRERRADRF